MKRFFKIALYLMPYALCLSSCDKVNDPYNAASGGVDTTVTKVRKVLLEDYTGHKCGNCPEAAITAQTIKSTYGERLIIMAVHAGSFAEPKAAPFGYDFRTVPGTAYDLFFKIGAAGNPNGMVNRKEYPGNTHIKSHGTWGSIVTSLMAEAPDAYIEMSNTYNSSNRTLTSIVNVEFLDVLSGDYKLAVLLTEDSIVKPQVDYSKPTGQQNVLDYVHHHVLRDVISNDSWGDMIATGGVAAGDTTADTLTYTLPANFNGLIPRENHCYVIAFVYDATTYEVIQVEEKKME